MPGPAATCTPPSAPESLLEKQWITRTLNLPSIEELFKEGHAFDEGVRSPSSSGTTGTKVAAGENGATSNSSDTDLIQYLHSLLTDFQPPTPTVSDPAAGSGSTVSSSGPASGNAPTVPVPGPQIPSANTTSSASAINSGITGSEAVPATATGGSNVGQGGNGNMPPTSNGGACEDDGEAAGNAAGGTETFYRGMSNAEYEGLQNSGGLSPQGESFVTQSLGFIQQLAARHPELYQTIIRFDMAPGTRDALLEAGARSKGNLLDEMGFGDMPAIGKGMIDVVHIKAERGAVTYGLRQGSADIFNSRILGLEECGP